MPPSLVTAKSYTDYPLQRGDKDKLKRWGGTVQPSSAGSPVADLQAALKAIGVFEVTPNGDYGPQTELAVRRFQWNAHNLKYWLINGALQLNAPNAMIPVTGTADTATAQELKKWVTAGAQTTGNLVRAPLNGYAQFINELTTISNPTVGANDMVVDADFLGALATLNNSAKGAKVQLYIEQAFRVSDVPATGAVVSPATKSQHLIGHAIDCNILDGTTRINSDTFKDGKQSDAANAFVKAAKDAGLRWGGDWSPVDYVHFDDFVQPNSDDYEMRYFFNQRTIAKMQPIPAAPAPA